LVTDFLLGNQSAAEYMEEVAKHGAEYNDFNLIVGDLRKSFGLSYYGTKSGISHLQEPKVIDICSHYNR
jgi:uncharacterized protein with NRDE domain